MSKHPEDETVRRAVGARLKAARHTVGWSQEKLAEALKLDVLTISRIETGRRSLTAAVAIRASTALGIPATVLLGVEEASVTEEEEAVQLLRQMDEKRRGMAIRMLREIAGM